MTRIAVLHKERCNPTGCGGYACIKASPLNRQGIDYITVGDDKKPVIHEELTNDACKICATVCPFDAISLVKLPEELSSRRIHRYGTNGFGIYSLPMPTFGSVVGILGKNAIGKSTALEIVAGILKPNFGESEKEANDDEIIRFFKGSENQKFFEMIKEKKITISYKPQQVTFIPKTVSGTVREVLQKADEQQKLNGIAEKLGITKILDNDIKKVSGGELQRIAIAATVLKKANLYIFDEPTSYLDIKQRLRVSAFLQEMIDEGKAILVVEHDLIILDYLADLINILYGKEDVYGITSMIRPSKRAINAYLDGYLREENIRIRPNKIRFEEKAPIEHKSKDLLVSWENVSKKLGSFEFTAEPGNLYRNEIVGVLGENGTGKTTFVSILAGAIEQDGGTINEKVTVSYKPQYLEASDDTVGDVLKEAQQYKTQLINPLGLTHLMNKKVSQLSGGELQRVAIVQCLAKDADLYLLDEPSAYLDVEQRLIVSKIIRDFIEKEEKAAIVVDHDLLFLDYLSHKLMVFSGEPARSGIAKGPFSMEKGMTLFLKELSITMRRDKETGRPRINKLDSVKDREQKKSGKYYYN